MRIGVGGSVCSADGSVRGRVVIPGSEVVAGDGIEPPIQFRPRNTPFPTGKHLVER